MGYRLIALDIDGTIISQTHSLSDRMRESMTRVMKTGANVTLATGRAFRSARPVSAELEIKSPIVCLQGAHIAEPLGGNVLLHRALTTDMARAALDALDSWSREVPENHMDQARVSQTTPRVKVYGQNHDVSVNIANLKEFSSNALTKLVVVGDQDDIQILESDLKARFASSLYITRSFPHYCEILHPSAGKDMALTWLCEYLGVDRSETLAFGNSHDDVHMLKWAALGVSPEDSLPEALEAADRIAPPVKADGVSQVLEELLTQGLIG